MKLDVTTIRLLSRLTDRMDLIRKHPHRYEIDPQDLADLAASASKVETLLAKVKTLKAG
jgi:hypothetical protein